MHNCWCHPSNKRGMDKIVDYLRLNIVNSIEDADIIYSPSEPLPSHNYPNKKFIFGPHFSVFPTDLAKQLNNKFNNTIYIQPSQPSVNTWVNEFGYTNVPVKSFPFPVDLPPISDDKKTEIVLYYKERSLSEFDYLCNMCKKFNITPHIIKYGHYNETDYQKLLDKTLYVIWHGRHESQGFALQSCWAKNIPTFVWSVKQRRQQINHSKDFDTHGFTEVSTVPYWDERCGIKFYEINNCDDLFDQFIKNLNIFKPKEFIVEKLSLEQCALNFLKLFYDN
jgi:hypothetical protein